MRKVLVVARDSRQVFARALGVALICIFCVIATSGCSDEPSKDPVKLARQANDGNVKAQLNLGLMYMKGDGGMPKDASKAAEWFQKAADQGNVKAQFYLGEMYLHGVGVPKNGPKASELLRAAADQGDAQAQLALAAVGFDGFIQLPGLDIDKARGWLQKAVDQGFAPAQFYLGNLYLANRIGGVEWWDSCRKGLELFQKAAGQGFVPAQFKLGEMYKGGFSIPADNGPPGGPRKVLVAPDNRKAKEWYEKAAAQGDKKAQEALNGLK